MAHRHYLITHRKRWALTQDELAALLGVSRSAVSAYERIIHFPTFDTLLRLEIVFGQTPSVLFPTLHALQEDAVMREAAKLREQLEGRADKITLRKLALLDDMMKRATDQQSAA